MTIVRIRLGINRVHPHRVSAQAVSRARARRRSGCLPISTGKNSRRYLTSAVPQRKVGQSSDWLLGEQIKANQQKVLTPITPVETLPRWNIPRIFCHVSICLSHVPKQRPYMKVFGSYSSIL